MINELNLLELISTLEYFNDKFVLPCFPGNSTSGHCFPVRVAHKEGVGRCVVAVREIEAGVFLITNIKLTFS